MDQKSSLPPQRNNTMIIINQIINCHFLCKRISYLRILTRHFIHMKKYLKTIVTLCSLCFTVFVFATTPSDASREPAVNTVSEASSLVPVAEANKPDKTPGAGAGRSDRGHRHRMWLTQEIPAGGPTTGAKQCQSSRHSAATRARSPELAPPRVGVEALGRASDRA